MLARRFEECKFEMHPTKKSIVYCKDKGRQNKEELNEFYTFKAVCIKCRDGKIRYNFITSVSNASSKAFRTKIKEMEVHKRKGCKIDIIADMLNSMIRGWINYFGKYNPSAMRGTLQCMVREMSGVVHQLEFMQVIQARSVGSEVDSLLSAVRAMALSSNLEDIIRIIQDKTKQPLNIPLRNSYGNAIADYILNERPDSDSEYLFLRSLAPYEKLEGAGAVWCILKLMEAKAGIHKEGRMAGSRFTRHNAASTMLRAGSLCLIFLQPLGTRIRTS